MVIYQKRLVSSIRAIQRSLEKRARVLRNGGQQGELSQLVKKLLPEYRERPETLTDKQRERIEDELQKVSTGQDPEQLNQELEVLEGLIERTRSIEVDSKAQELREFIESLLNEDPDEKVLVFTEYTDTLEYLRDEVLEEYDTAQIHGSMGQQTRREQVEKFRGDANVMLATDAAREGINLQFAHIMVNYDLPWNPIRIDQRMGRLHRYGQDRDVHIHNLFVDDTRESEILEQLVEKIDRIENDLGMRSDVLGMVLDDSDFDLEERIMDAVTNDKSSKKVVDDLDKIIEERKEAVKTVQENFLISDQFGESDLKEIQDLIEDSRKDHIGQSEVRELLELFFAEFDGEIKERSNHRLNGKVFSIDVPGVIELGREDVRGSYSQATFDQDLAKEDSNLEFLSVNHPVVQAIVEYCLDGNWIDGRTVVKRAADPSTEPGLRCNFRLGYETADGRDETEEFVSMYVTADGDVWSEIPDSDGSISPDRAEKHQQVSRVTENARDLVDVAKREAQLQVEAMAEEAEKEKEENVDIKRQHAERYFENAINTWESRLEEYQQDHRNGKDMKLPIRNAKSKLEEIRDERKHEFEQLREEESVLPKAPELVNAAVMVPDKK